MAEKPSAASFGASSQGFSSLQPKHTSRQMRQYVVTEAELDQISLLNTVTSWLFSASSGSFLFAIGLIVNGVIEMDLSGKAVALLQFGIPTSGILGLLFAIVGVVSWWKKKSILRELKQQSQDIDQISLLTDSQSIQPMQ